MSISQLAKEHVGIRQMELECVNPGREVWPQQEEYEDDDDEDNEE